MDPNVFPFATMKIQQIFIKTDIICKAQFMQNCIDIISFFGQATVYDLDTHVAEVYNEMYESHRSTRNTNVLHKKNHFKSDVLNEISL